MSQHRPVKGLALYTGREREIWQEAESEARSTVGESAREGEVLAYICAEYLAKRGTTFQPA